MFKSLRVPERLFAIAMWLVSLIFAGFLTQLGGKIIGDLPGYDQTLTLDQFADSTALKAAERERLDLQRRERELLDEQERARLVANASTNAYHNAQSEFSNWIATRAATTDPQQDPEVIRRTRRLDTLNTARRAAEREVEVLDSALLVTQQGTQAAVLEAENIRQDGYGRYERARFAMELRVFLIRLALTLPLLVGAWWLITRKRKSQYWPLARGFVLFAVLTFFVELVPYLPSYGGYIHAIVGVILTAAVAHYIVKAFRRYLAQRQVAEQLSEPERRATLDFETALKRMSLHVCPACERPISTAPGAAQDFCVYCGLRLFDDCSNCGTHKNAFFQYCPKCGVVGTDANA